MSLSTDEIGEIFVRAQVERNPVTLKVLAAEHGRNYEALRTAAAKGKWSSRAAVACNERDSAVARKIADQNALTACVMEQVVEREAQVRQRHARLARSLQHAALERLVAIRPDELSARLAVEMLRIGIHVEREALGLGDLAPKLPDDGDDNSHVREAVEEAMIVLARHAGSLGPESVSDGEKGADNTTTMPSSPADAFPRRCNQLQSLRDSMDR